MVFLHVVGNLIGRLLVSYFIVWLVCLAGTRGDWRAALRRTRRWYAFMAVLFLFLAGLGATIGLEGGIDIGRVTP